MVPARTPWRAGGLHPDSWASLRVFTLPRPVTPGAGWKPGSDGKYPNNGYPGLARRQEERARPPNPLPSSLRQRNQPLTPRSSGPRQNRHVPGPPESLIYHSRGDPNDNAPCPRPAVNRGPPLLPPCPPGTPPAPHPCHQGQGATAREWQAGEVAGGIKEALLPSPPPLPPFRGQNANGYFPPRPS